MLHAGKRAGGTFDRPSRWAASTLGFAALVVASVVTPTLHAEGKTAFLAEQLKKNADYRVRTSAALSLGTSDDVAAVKPLCQCLDDGSENESVRVACAAALGKLKKPGSDVCLKAHASDSSKKVSEQVGTSLKALGGGSSSSAGGDAACPPGPAGAKAKYYVGVTINNKTDRPDGEIRSMIGREARCKLVALGRFRVAGDDETDAKKMDVVVRKEKLDGLLLAITVDPIKYEGGNLKIALRLTLMTHTRDIKGEISKSLAMPGVSAHSKPDEDDLLKMAVGKLVNDFAGLKP